mgnify:CR=1 FL=1
MFNTWRFEARQEEHLLALREALVNRTYAPARSVCFVVQRPKLREIFAADFREITIDQAGCRGELAELAHYFLEPLCVPFHEPALAAHHGLEPAGADARGAGYAQ